MAAGHGAPRSYLLTRCTRSPLFPPLPCPALPHRLRLARALLARSVRLSRTLAYCTHAHTACDVSCGTRIVHVCVSWPTNQKRFSPVLVHPTLVIVIVVVIIIIVIYLSPFIVSGAPPSSYTPRTGGFSRSVSSSRPPAGREQFVFSYRTDLNLTVAITYRFFVGRRLKKRVRHSSGSDFGSTILSLCANVRRVSPFGRANIETSRSCSARE